MKIRNRMCEENPAGRRILCRVLLLMVTGIFLLYVLGGARFFSALRPSECEKLLRDGQQVQAYGRVYKKGIKGDTYVLYMENVRVRGDNISQSTKIVCEEQMLVYLSEDKVKSLAQIDDAVPKIGQTIMVCGTISFFQDAPNPGNFNQRFYYQKQNIHAAIQKAEILSNITVSEERERNGKWSLNLREFLWQFRGGIAEIIRENMDEKHSGILCAMLLGENAYVDEELKEIYQKSGIGHLLAISGLHVSFVGMGLYQILRKMGVHVSVAAVAGSIFLCFYVVMSGESVSAVRACVMFLMRMGAVVTGREYDGLTALSAAALVVLGKNPLRLFDAGFLLSFGAILGIYAVRPLVWREKGGKIKDTLKMSAAMQMTVSPVLLYYYYEICVYSGIWNLFAVPLSGMILGSAAAGVAMNGTAHALAGRVGQGVGKVLIKMLKYIGRKAFAIVGAGLEFYEAGSNLILSFPGSRWTAGQPYWGQLAVYYAALAGLLLLCWRKRAWFLKLLCVAIAAAALLYPHGKRGELEIVMMNVGQGDCFFLRGPDGTTGLVDGGSSSVDQVGKYRLEPFLKSQGVGTLDYVWISHGDIDHLSGVEELLQRQKVGVKIRSLVLPPQEYWEERIWEMARLAWKQRICVFTMGRGQSFESEGMSLTCISPDRVSEDEDDAVLAAKSGIGGNESSMVLSLSYGKFDMLFTGDLEKDGEKEVIRWMKEAKKQGELPESYEVLKVGHHGSKYATSEELLETVRPVCAWVSAGEGNRYGHPHKDVLERLANWKVRLYNTKDGNAVKLCTDGKKYCILIP